ncbi:hypothetical protein CEP52_007727 [Fusarium oligoseptatum]|uniref:Uncharacterized protein n=1 Tax=Fusarium oligoseptatum TaxID=2604345 RepID=A0A428TL85_9HYPO|nr:hypothetical protein CEP52_007727 [Fusarium oligoseptatum]
MAIVDLLLSWWTLPIAVAVFVGTYLYSYFVTYGYLRGIPAPFPAQFFKSMAALPDDEAIPIIYGHGNGFLKS